MTDQWQELKETITEMRDNDGTGTQQEVCKFLVNYMGILEKQMQEPCDVFDEYGNYKYPSDFELTEPNTATSMPCGDAISRQAAIEAFQMFREYYSNRSNKEWVNRIEVVLNQLPPVNPQPKTGHWIHRKMDNECWEECSECHVERGYPTLYCPDCGIKMVEEQKGSKE